MTTKHRIAIGLLLAIYLVFLIRNSWASDDAFITLRVVRNLFHGYGLRWNGAERVQVFTHPLWLMVLTLFYALARNPFFTLYAACFAFSAATVFLLLLKFSRPSWMLPLATAALLASKSFMDYSSSGLENPLSHFLFLLFLWIFLSNQEYTDKKSFLLSLLLGLSMLNRLDTLLILLPAYLLLLWQIRGNFRNLFGKVISGFLPILLWEVFSLFYYGFPFPNTYYAKLTTGIPQSELYQQGWFYFKNSIAWDHVTLPVIALAVLLSFLQREPKRISLALGILLHLGYILRIGGDFMSGRFFSAPFLLSLALILSLPKLQSVNFGPAISTAATCLILVAGLTSNHPPILIQATEYREPIDAQGIADEKLVYFRCCSLLGQWKSDAAIKIADDARKAEQLGVQLVIRESIGIYGFYTGPEVYIMDKVCLSDPLRARLPVTGTWRIGHFYRDYPSGYPESIENGFVNQIREPHLREYYDKLMLVTRGGLFAPERLKTILLLNLGAYDHLLDEYIGSGDLKTQ